MIKKIAVLAILIGTFGLSSDLQAKSIYRQGNNPANYVRLVSLKTSKAETMSLNQPYTFTEDQLTDILRSLRFNRRAIFSDKVRTRRIFEEEYIEKYVPYLVKAFQEATPFQTVFWSVAQKRPYFIIRNDRLTQVNMWVTGQELHIRFDKTEAKLLGDYQARTPEGRKMRQQAKGLRISIEPQEGQKFAFDSSKEIIVNINSDWSAIVQKIEDEEARIAKEMEISKAKGSKKKRLQAEAEAEAARNQQISEKDRKSAEERLGELKRLKDKGLIDQKDYDKKKKEILENL